MAELITMPQATVVALEPVYDSLGEARLEALRSQLLDAASRVDPPRLLVDMSQTEFIGSRFVELVFRAGKRLAERGGQLAICGASPFCCEVLHVLQLDLLFPLYPSREMALAALAASGNRRSG